MNGQPVEFPSFVAVAVDGMSLFRSYGEWSIRAADEIVEFIKAREAARANTTPSAVVALELHLFVPDIDDAVTFKCIDDAQCRQQRRVLRDLEDGPYAWTIHSTRLRRVESGKVKAVGEDARFATTCRNLLHKQLPPYGASINSVHLDAMYIVTSDGDHVATLNSDTRACLVQLRPCVDLSRWSTKYPARGAMWERGRYAQLDAAQPRGQMHPAPTRARDKSAAHGKLQPGATIWVGGVPVGMSADRLERHLCRFGKVVSVALKLRRAPFAFVSYGSKAAADRALSQGRVEVDGGCLLLRPVAATPPSGTPQVRQGESGPTPRLVSRADVENLVQTFGCSRRQAQDAITKARGCVATAGSFIAAELYDEASDDAEGADDDEVAVVVSDDAARAAPALAAPAAPAGAARLPAPRPPVQAPPPIADAPVPAPPVAPPVAVLAEVVDADAAPPPMPPAVADLMSHFGCSAEDAQDALSSAGGDLRRAGQLLGERLFGDNDGNAAPVTSDAQHLADTLNVPLAQAQEALRKSHGNIHVAAGIILGA
jgi:hypothetical protein